MRFDICNEVFSVFIMNNGKGIDEDSFWISGATYDTCVQRIKSVILGFENTYPWASHKVTGKLNGESGAHAALYDAAVLARQEKTIGGQQYMDFRVYRIYQHANSPDTANPSASKMFIGSDTVYKQAALNEYKHVNPSFGRYGIGYHNAQVFIDPAHSGNYNDTEFVDCLHIDDDCLGN